MSIAQDKARLDRLVALFDTTVMDVNTSTDLSTSMHMLEKLKNTEMRTWWDSNTLRMYIDRDMIPRGLRLKKLPTTIYSTDFSKEWNETLSKCSIDLIKLITRYEDVKLIEIKKEIETLQTTMDTKFASLAEYKDLITKMDNNLKKTETSIEETKKRKYQRDIQDYAQDKVYTWKPPYKNPRPILRNRGKYRNKKSQQNVSFSDPESADSNTDTAASDCDASSNASSNKGQKKNNKKQLSEEESSSTPFLGVTNQRRGAEAATPNPPRYPKRGTKD